MANAGIGRSEVLAFWFGESDEATPADVGAAAIRSLAEGETFYAHNLGLPELRQAIAAYVSELHGPVGPQRIAVTSSAVSALMSAMQALLDPGDEVVAVVPIWPNLTAQPEILGAVVRRVALRPQAGAWRLDLQGLLDAIAPRTRVLLINAPNNPTGWARTRAEQEALLAHCRRTGTWVVADEVYERLYYVAGQRCAPSFLDVAQSDDKLIVAHSFSKSFVMTGWRLGWLVAPQSLMEGLGKLIEFNTSCAPTFVQRAGVAVLASAEASVPALVQRLKTCRDTLVPQLATLPGIELALPQAGMYAFFRVEAQPDSLAFAKRLVAEVGLGLAPGVAFAPQAEGWLRWCFATREPSRLSDGVQRLRRALRL